MQSILANMNISKDVFLKIVEYLPLVDALNLSCTCKEYNFIANGTYFWIVLGKRDYPIFEIENKRDYQKANPMFVFKEDMVNELKTNKWAIKHLSLKRMNRNGVEDHLVEAFVKSIIKGMLIVKNYREIYEKYSGKMPVDWRISMNWMIDQILKETEKEEKELQNINGR